MKRTTYEVWIKTSDIQTKEPVMVMIGKFYEIQMASLFKRAYKDEYGITPVIFLAEDDQNSQTAYAY